MGIIKSIEIALNIQIKEELFSAYLYLSMAAWFKSKGLDGFAHWMQIQAQEELNHAMKFYNYILERGGRVELLAIDKPASKFNSALAIFEAAFKHEESITILISNLVNISRESKDHATESFLKWFVDEQVEEEASADAVVQKLRMAGDNGPSLMLLDKEMAQRPALYIVGGKNEN